MFDVCHLAAVTVPGWFCYVWIMVDFLIIGLKNSIAYGNIVGLYVEDKIRYGYNSVYDYEDGETAPGWWFSSMDVRRPYNLQLKKDYDLDDYSRFDERPDCINIDRKEDIPDGYYGLMGVPGSVMMDIDRNLFDILGVVHRGVQKYDLWTPYVDGEFKFTRWIIRRKDIKKI